MDIKIIFLGIWLVPSRQDCIEVAGLYSRSGFCYSRDRILLDLMLAGF